MSGSRAGNAGPRAASTVPRLAGRGSSAAAEVPRGAGQRPGPPAASVAETLRPAPAPRPRETARGKAEGRRGAAAAAALGGLPAAGWGRAAAALP